jgi:hypothetical protein
MSAATHEERNENGGVHKHQGEDGSPAVAKTVGDGTSQKYTNKGTTLTRLEEGTLPPGWDSITTPLHWYSVSLLESSLRDKVTIQKHVKGLHDLLPISTAKDAISAIRGYSRW